MERTEKEKYLFAEVLMLANKFQIWGDGVLDDMTMKQWFLLAVIDNMTAESPTVTEVADFSGTTRQNAKKHLSQLEAKGYVSLTRSKSDARAWSVGLTAKMRAYFESHDEVSTAAVHALFSDVPDDELDAAIRAAERLLRHLSHDMNPIRGKE